MRTALFAARLTRELSDSEQTTLFSCLPPERRTRFLRGKARAGRSEILCAYGLLRVALRLELSWRELPPVALTDRGKPFFPDYPSVCFSLSHADGAALVGLSPAPIGVDIEKTRPVRPRLMKRAAGTDDLEAFFREWVALEAVGKHDGGGLAGVWGADVPASSDAGYLPAETWPGYFAGVACSSGEVPSETRLYVV